MRLFAVAAVALLVGCAVQPVEYAKVAPPKDPRAIIERVLMEQPERFRNGYATVTDEYMEYGSGSTTKGPVFGTKSVEKPNVVRVYYASIAQDKLYPKSDYWRIDTLNTQGAVIGRAYSYDRSLAEQYIAALEAMRNNAPK